MLCEEKTESTAITRHSTIPTNTPLDSTLKRRENDRFHVVSTWNPRGVFDGIVISYDQQSQKSSLSLLSLLQTYLQIF